MSKNIRLALSPNFVTYKEIAKKGQVLPDKNITNLFYKKTGFYLSFQVRVKLVSMIYSKPDGLFFFSITLHTQVNTEIFGNPMSFT